jgi:branched-chain amino acid transport system substrate-binding protein
MSRARSDRRVTRRKFVQSTVIGAGTLGMPFVSRAFGAETIPVGIVVGLTGAAATYGVSVADAAKLVTDDINRNGGIKSKGGAKIELIVADHQSQAVMAGTLVERLIELQKVICVIGNAFSVATVVGSKVAEATKTPFLSSDVSDLLSEQGFKYYFRIGPKASFLAATAVDFAIESARATGIAPKKVVILADDSAYAQTLVRGIQQAYPKTGWEPAEVVSYQFGKVSDFSSTIQRLRLTGVDLLFQGAYPADGINIVRAMKSVDYSPIAAIHVAGAPYAPPFINALKSDADYITCAIGFVPELVSSNKYLADFNKLYETTFKRPLDDQASQGAVIMGTLYDALERASDLTRESLVTALRATDLQIGSNPYISRDGVKFDGRGDNTRVNAIIMQLRNQEQKIVYPQKFATTKLVWPMVKWSDRKSG